MAQNLARFRADRRSSAHFTEAFLEVVQILLTAKSDNSFAIDGHPVASDDNGSSSASGADTPPSEAVNHVHFSDSALETVQILDSVSAAAEDAAVNAVDVDTDF